MLLTIYPEGLDYLLIRITNHESRITNHESRITNHESRITNHESRITNHESRITNHEITDARLYTTPFAGCNTIGIRCSYIDLFYYTAGTG
ncbi:MAG: hypothetical protein C1941_03930 [Prosthecochloris sp.]|nr:hypothetical protein [Prosthecochloris sp.]